MNFSKKQSAYRQLYHSTETALLSILNDVYGKIDKGRSTLLVALDISAAFDTVEHPVLLRRLEACFGVTGSALSWISSYFSDRSQFVRLDSFLSPVESCFCGVPQGSVLSPLLFVAYTAPMSTIADHFGVQYHQYADDTQIYVALSKDWINETTANLQNCLAEVHLWLSQNGLVINPDKSESVLFSTAQRARIAPLPLSTVNVAGAVTPIAVDVKLLGVTLDQHLTFNKHIQNVCRSSYYHIRALKHIRSSLSEDVAKTIACAFVSSRLDYSNSVWFGISKSNISRLQRVQNSLARVVTRSRRNDHITPILKRLHWLPISYRIQFKIATLTFKMRETGHSEHFKQIVADRLPTIALRSSDKHFLNQHPVKIEIAKRAFSQAAPSVWNSLPLSCRTANTFSVFKKLLKTHIFKLAYPD